MANPNAVLGSSDETEDDRKKRDEEIKALEEAYSKPAFEQPSLADSLLGQNSGENGPKSLSDLLAADLNKDEKDSGSSLFSRREDASNSIKGLFERNRDEEEPEEATEEAPPAAETPVETAGETESATTEDQASEAPQEPEQAAAEAQDSLAGEPAAESEPEPELEVKPANETELASRATKVEAEPAAEPEPEAEDEPESDEDKQEKQKKTGASTGSPFKVAEGPRKTNANTEGDQTEHLKNLDRKQIQKEFIAAADPDQGPTRLAKRFGGEQAAWTAFLAENYLKHRGKDSIQSEEDITRDTMNAQINDESEGSVRTKDAIRDLESKAHKAEYTQRIAKVQKDLELPQEKVTEQAAQDKSAEQEDTLEQEEPEDENDSTVEQQPDADAENTSEDTENSENDEQLDEEPEEQASAEEDDQNIKSTEKTPENAETPKTSEDEEDEEDEEAPEESQPESPEQPEEEDEDDEATQEEETSPETAEGPVSVADVLAASALASREYGQRDKNTEDKLTKEEAIQEGQEDQQEQLWYDRRKSQQLERQRPDRQMSRAETLNQSTREEVLERRKEARDDPTAAPQAQQSQSNTSQPAPQSGAFDPQTTLPPQLAKTELFSKNSTSVQQTRQDIYRKSLRYGFLIGFTVVVLGVVAYLITR